MFEEVIVLILVILVMNLFLIYLIKSLSNKFKAQMRESTLKILGSFDELIIEKEKKLNALKDEISKFEFGINKYDKLVKSNTKNNKPKTNSRFISKFTEYENDKFFVEYAYLKNSFKLNYEDIVREYLNSLDKIDLGLYEIYKSVVEKIDINTYYNLMKIEDENKEESLRSLISKNEEKVLEEYYNNYETFTIEDFYEFINNRLTLLNPQVLIRGNGDFKYLEKIDSRIRFKNDNSIVEGIEILYQGKVIDYSL